MVLPERLRLLDPLLFSGKDRAIATGQVLVVANHLRVIIVAEAS